jgi:hypothetical protein
VIVSVRTTTAVVVVVVVIVVLVVVVVGGGTVGGGGDVGGDVGAAVGGTVTALVVGGRVGVLVVVLVVLVLVVVEVEVAAAVDVGCGVGGIVSGMAIGDADADADEAGADVAMLGIATAVVALRGFTVVEVRGRFCVVLGGMVGAGVGKALFPVGVVGVVEVGVVVVEDRASLVGGMVEARGTEGGTTPFDEPPAVTATTAIVETEGVTEAVAVVDVLALGGPLPVPAAGEFCSTTTVDSEADVSPGLVAHHTDPPRTEMQSAAITETLDRLHPEDLTG